MKARLLALAACIGSVLALSACGGSPTESLDFKSPPGWTSPFAAFGFQLWLKNSTTGSAKSSEMIALYHKSGVKASDVHVDDSLKGNPYFQNGDVEGKTEVIKICGNHPATFAHAVGSQNGKRSVSDIVMTNWNDSDFYFAIYARPDGMPADAAAETAIRSLCKKQ